MTPNCKCQTLHANRSTVRKQSNGVIRITIPFQGDTHFALVHLLAPGNIYRKFKEALARLEHDARARFEAAEVVDLVRQFNTTAHQMGFDVSGFDPADAGVRERELMGRATI